MSAATTVPTEFCHFFRRRAALFDCGLLDAMPENLVRIKKGDQLFGRDRFTYKNLADIPVILEQLGCKL